MEPFSSTASYSQSDKVLNDRPNAVVNNDLEAGILSDADKTIAVFVNYVTICGLVSLFGIIANIINIVIFYKQGFVKSVNIAFLSLAISDLFSLTALLWASVCVNHFLPVYDVTWVSIDVMYLSAALPHLCFSRITGYITVYITAERFISIAWPMQVKQIITATRTTTIICLIFFINLITFIPEYATSFLGWKRIPYRNKTLICIMFTSSRVYVEGLCYVLHALLSATSFVAVIIFTFALVIKLRQSSKWRKDATLDQFKKESSSDKEQKTVKMVVLIATVLIICYTPGAIISVASFIIGPEFNVSGRFVNICQAVWSTACCFQSINSSVNIFLYYKMSSAYRKTFNDIFAKVLYNGVMKTRHI